MAQEVHQAFRLFWPAIALQLILSIIYSLPPKISDTRIAAALRVCIIGASCALVAAWSYLLLTEYPPFAGYVPFIVAHALLFGWLVISSIALNTRRAALGYSLTGAYLAGFVLSHLANTYFYPGLYPTLHMSTLFISFVFLLFGVTGLFFRLPLFAKFEQKTLAVSIPLFILPPSLALAVSSGFAQDTRPHFLNYTLTGQWITSTQDGEDGEESGSSLSLIAEDPHAVARFKKHSGLPLLGKEFKLEEYNVLFIASEATRFDQTSLAKPAMDTTPQLQKWVQSGVFSFDRAYAPSSGTLHSIGSIFSMTYPSAVHHETWSRPWFGEYYEDNDTVAEIFKRSGYQTFWIGHNYARNITRYILGFEQGFDERRLVPTGYDTGKADELIADAAVQALRKFSNQKPKFFGWIFFVSPHGKYGAHDPDRPKKTHMERYRQEIRFMDEQLGRVLEALKKYGLYERTVIVFAGDHGEEFKEHGGTRHKSTVYSESVHVPLVIHIPGMRGRPLKAPTSTYYLFPWLFLHGTSDMRQDAEKKLRAEIGPMMRETDNAVVVELIGHDRMRSSLVYPDYKINYDFRSKLFELFAVSEDPLEQNNLFDKRPDLAKTYIDRLARYRQVRDSNKRYKIYSKKKGKK